MALWFAVLAVSGLRAGRRGARRSSRRCRPTLRDRVLRRATAASRSSRSAAVVLAVTGAEALYADMGHFGRPPIRRAWFLFVFPALTLNYLGQGALMLSATRARSRTRSSCWSPTGRGSRWSCWRRSPTVIASQAVISGAFSVTRQAVQLGFLPRLTHPPHLGARGRPGLRAGRQLGAVRRRRARSWSASAPRAALASAYGIAVTGTLAIDTILFFVVVRVLWQKPPVDGARRRGACS